MLIYHESADVDGTLRYIGEESDPIGAPPILAPLLAPGAVPAARPMSAIADVGYGLPPSGTVPSYEANDPHLFAYKPIDETAYPGPLAGEASTSQYQNEYHQYEPRRPDTAQPLWPQHVPEGT